MLLNGIVNEYNNGETQYNAARINKRAVNYYLVDMNENGATIAILYGEGESSFYNAFRFEKKIDDSWSRIDLGLYVPQ